MEAHTCNHPKVPHTVTWWVEDGRAVPFGRDFKDLESADIFAQKIIRQNRDRPGGCKIHRSDNDSYVCFLWENDKEKPVESQKVKLEVDMEPLASTFENVALGFKNQAKMINRLKVSQTIVSIILVIDMLGHLLT